MGLSACSDPSAAQDITLRDAYSTSSVLEPPERLQTQLDYFREIGVDDADFKGILFLATFEQQNQFAGLSYQMWLTAEGLWGIVIEGDEVVIRRLRRDSVHPFESAYVSMNFKAESLGGRLQLQSLSKDADENLDDEQRMADSFGKGTLMEKDSVFYWKPSGSEE